MIIDLSRAIENDVPADPPGFGPVVAYADHKTGAQEMISLFPGLHVEDLPDGEAIRYDP
jgi:hypothetical protein